MSHIRWMKSCHSQSSETICTLRMGSQNKWQQEHAIVTSLSTTQFECTDALCALCALWQWCFAPVQNYRVGYPTWQVFRFHEPWWLGFHPFPVPWLYIKSKPVQSHTKAIDHFWAKMWQFLRQSAEKCQIIWLRSGTEGSALDHKPIFTPWRNRCLDVKTLSIDFRYSIPVQTSFPFLQLRSGGKHLRRENIRAEKK